MVTAANLQPGTFIRHAPSDGRYCVLSAKLKLRNPVSGVWYEAVRYSNEDGEEFVRAKDDFASFVLEFEPRQPPKVDNTLQADLSSLYRRLLSGAFYRDYDEDARLTGVLRQFAEARAPELDELILNYQLYYDTASNSSDEPEADRAEYARVLQALRTFRVLLAEQNSEPKLIAAYEASPEFQLEQPHPTEAERAACDVVTRAAQAGKLALTICTNAQRERVPVLAAMSHQREGVLFSPVARLLPPAEADALRLGQPNLDGSYITADNRSGH